MGEAMVGLDGGPIRIRVGIHTGEPALDPPKYVGIDVHRAARIMSSAHGGQVVLSRETVEILPDETFVLVDLGDHRFKDLGAPERVYQLGEGDHPPLKSLYRVTLPVPATPFLGREAELATVVELLTSPDTRVLTLTGPGGTGKTRLALQAAAEASDQFPDGVTWVALAPLRDPALVLPTVAQALDVKERADEPLVDTLARTLLGKKTLLLLDNLEHLLPQAARDLAALTDACPTLTTARHQPRTPADQRRDRVARAPDVRQTTASSCSSSAPEPPGSNSTADETVRELCRRLDELPLAIQLAAARTRSLSPAAILERLDQRLDLLTSGRPRRRRTPTHARSDDRLVIRPPRPAEEQRVVCARCSVFAGGCTLDAAEHVAGRHSTRSSRSSTRASSGTGSTTAGQDRYWMLETIRQYATSSNSMRPARPRRWCRAHASYFGARLGPMWRAVRHYDETATATLEADLDNGREALAAVLDAGDADTSAKLLTGLWALWLRRGLNREAMAAVERYLPLDRSGVGPATRLEGDLAASEILRFSGDPVRARELKQSVLELARSFPGHRAPRLRQRRLGGLIMATLVRSRRRRTDDG